MNTKLAACLLALALLVGWVFYLLTGERGGAVRGSGGGLASEPASTEAAHLTDGLAPAALPRDVAREASAPVATGPVSASPRSELAGLVGRVVESDGRPVVGMRVALLEFDGLTLFDGDALGEEPESLELEETETDDEGRFLLGGAHMSAMHGLGVDLGGPRATIRVIDHALPHRERTDIGDVVLAPFGVLTGRVLDESGAPVAGARVRCGAFPEEILQASPQDFRSDSLIAIGLTAMGGEGHLILEPPGWIRGMLDRLPVPTTQSAADGTFRLEGVPLARVVGGIDKRGYVGVPLGPIDMAQGDQNLGDLVLTRGRTLKGVVEDTYGESVADVEVFAGAELFPGVAAVLQPCGRTDAEGRFELTGVAESNQVVAATRRAPFEPWSTTATPRYENVLLEVEETVELTVNVRDEQGKPLSGARLLLTPASGTASRAGFLSEALMFLPRPPCPGELFREVEPGRYVVNDLGAGRYDVTARVPGLAPATQMADCTAGPGEVTVVCTAGRRVELRVVDAVAKAPVSGARASVLHVGQGGFQKLFAVTTDEAGGATLGPLPELSPPASPQGFMENETMLLVQHPRYGDFSATLDPLVSPLVVALEAGGTLAGRVHWGGAVPTRLYMLTLEYRGADGFLEVFHMPSFALTDLAGEFRVSNLIPGEYRVALMERFLDKDPLGLMGTDFDPPTLYRETVEIRNGETTTLDIDLTPTGRGATARLVGRVRVDGRGLAGAEVEVRGNERVQVVTDASGRFETEPFSVRGTSWVRVEGDVRMSDGVTRRQQLHEETLELQNEEVRELDLDLYPLTLRVRVVDAASGAPVALADISANAKESGVDSGEATTNDSGEVELLILRPGDYIVKGSAEGYGKGASAVTVPAEGLFEPTVLRLSRAVPCAGRVSVDPSLVPEGRGFAYVQVHGTNGSNSVGTMLRAPEYTFTLEGLSEGEYRALIYLGGRQSQEVPFVLGPSGDQDLTLNFVPQQ